MAMNQTNYGLKAKADRADYFVFFSLSNLVAQLRQAAYGTIFDTVTTKTFEQSKIIIPQIPLIQYFDRQVAPIMEQILNDLQQSATLAAIRDALLPKLMNGQIPVSADANACVNNIGANNYSPLQTTQQTTTSKLAVRRCPALPPIR